VLELDGLTRRFGDKIALDNLSFSVAPGEVVGFLGPNGAGKTTAMRAVLGIVRLDSGVVRWNAKVADLSDRLHFGYMPEERGLYNSMSVIDQLIFLGRLHGMGKQEATEAGQHWLETLGVQANSRDRLDSLSLGNQQRVQMAAALLHTPQLLVLDEPFSGLDPTGTEALSDVLKRRALDGTAVVFSSHQLDLVEGLCERVIIINAGRKVAEGSVDELTTSDRILNVRVEEDPAGAWSQNLKHVTVERIEHGNVRIHLQENGDQDAVLREAMAAGSVRHFTFERKRLSEVFREAVSAP
jgi:ABC-2 type transport system ATP-binding protein